MEGERTTAFVSQEGNPTNAEESTGIVQFRNPLDNPNNEATLGRGLEELVPSTDRNEGDNVDAIEIASARVTFEIAADCFHYLEPEFGPSFD